jgi:cytochrome P450
MEVKIQPLVDLLFTKLNDLGQSGQKPVDTATLIAHFAFDAMGIINVSEPFGFLSKGVDVEGAIGAIEVANTYFSVIAQAPWMHTFMLGNRFVQKAMEGGNPVLNLALAMVDKRLAAAKATTNGKKHQQDTTDFLGKLLEASESAEVSKAGDIPKPTYEQIVAFVLANTMAGYATVAVALRSILYHLARNPDAYTRLQRELDEAFASGALSQTHTVAEAGKLPYLDAVVTEALRVHPVLGLILEREVPAGGAVLAGQHVPEGTVVGFNPWVIMHNREVYGEDADVFRPERWLGVEEGKLKEMRRCNITVSFVLPSS